MTHSSSQAQVMAMATSLTVLTATFFLVGTSYFLDLLTSLNPA